MELKANELRIGNLIECFGVREVIDIKKEKIKVKHEKSEDHFITEYCPINSLSLKPIPLTEEWLFKLGFINDKVLDFYRNDFTDSTIIIDYNFICLLGYSHVKLKYVHQLQNLYFALTNEELEIKM